MGREKPEINRHRISPLPANVPYSLALFLSRQRKRAKKNGAAQTPRGCFSTNILRGEIAVGWPTSLSDVPVLLCWTEWRGKAPTPQPCVRWDLTTYEMLVMPYGSAWNQPPPAKRVTCCSGVFRDNRERLVLAFEVAGERHVSCREQKPLPPGPDALEARRSMGRKETHPNERAAGRTSGGSL